MSKVLHEAIEPFKKDSFLMREFGKEGFAAPFHFHIEYELTYILEGKGKRFIGNNMMRFLPGDLVLVGSNLPHCWKLDTGKNLKARSLVIQFTYNFLGEYFFKANELLSIQKMLAKSNGGIHFTGKITIMIKDQMQKLNQEKNTFRKLILLLEILNKLSFSREHTLLNKNNYAVAVTDSSYEKINKVYAYVVDNFQDCISLEAASGTINMTPNAFCKYFKRVTRNTFMETVISFRINYATQQLIETDKSVADVCYDSGFRDMSHFYKMFNSRMKMSPLNYRKQFLSETA